MKFAITILQILLYAPNILGTISSCYKDHYSWIYKNYCLEIILIEKSWYDARNYCTYRGGDLVEIRTQDFQNSVAQHLSTHHGGHNGFWIGATDTEKEGWWRWMHDPRGMSYSNWSPGRGASGRRRFIFGSSANDCAMIRTDDNYRWQDGPCEGVISLIHYSFICQYEMAPDTKSTGKPITQPAFPTQTTEPTGPSYVPSTGNLSTTTGVIIG